MVDQPPLQATRRPERLNPDDRRVIIRHIEMHNRERVRHVAERVNAMSDEQVERLLAGIAVDFASRHRDMEQAFQNHYNQVARFLRNGIRLTPQRQLLMGAYFTSEYSIESAALFNPSIIPHPDQSELPKGSVRLLMSLRATGEGHVSSIVFRRGVIEANGAMHFEPAPRHAYSARPQRDPKLDKRRFIRKLTDMGVYEELVRPVVQHLPDHFTLDELQAAIDQARKDLGSPRGFRSAAADIRWLARAHYELSFPADCRPAEIVIFPATDNEQRGMEDLRLVRFVDTQDRPHYYGTYTAFNGSRILPMLLETTDFHNFQVGTLSGKHARNKGMALFPRKVGGQYLMVSRHDGENLYLLSSDSVYSWNHAELLQTPQESWEFLQIGNCGSPLETEAGWILLTHGVGPVREYSMGALLLDRENPARVIGRLRQPLLGPVEDEREGYVPNVVYSCGSMIHRDTLIIPYAMSDSRTSFATILVSTLIERLLDAGP